MRASPFGLTVVVPIVAGPFNLGNVSRALARSASTRHTAQVTVTSDPLPQIVDGIPLQIKTVNVTIERQGFMFDPTNCDSRPSTATIASNQGATAGLSRPVRGPRTARTCRSSRRSQPPHRAGPAERTAPRWS